MSPQSPQPNFTFRHGSFKGPFNQPCIQSGPHYQSTFEILPYIYSISNLSSNYLYVNE